MAIYNKLIAIVKIKRRLFSGFELYAKKPSVLKRNFFTVKSYQRFICNYESLPDKSDDIPI